MPPRITQESCRPRVSDRTMVGTVRSGSCLQSVRAERQPTIMKPTATSSGSTARCLQGRHASIWRHGEIYRKGRRPSLGQAATRPSAQPFDEFPVGYSWASCSPAEPASASPTVFHFAVNGQSRRDCVAHPSSPPQTGLDAEKTSRCPAREKCFYLTSPLIEPATRIPGAHNTYQLRHTASVGYSQPNSSSRSRHKKQSLFAQRSCYRAWGISRLLRVPSG